MASRIQKILKRLCMAPCLAMAASGCAKSKSLSDLIVPNFTFGFSAPSTTLPVGYKGQNYSFNFGTNNGEPPVTFTLDSGSVPGGLSLSSAGILSGPITGAVGTYNFTVKAVDGRDKSSSVAFTLTVQTPFSLLTTSLSNAVVNVAYTGVLVASGGVSPYTYTATGLPTGLTLAPSTGILTGTATVLGSYSLSVTVTDSVGQVANVSMTLSVVVSPGAPTIGTLSVSDGTLGVYYAAAIAGSGGIAPTTYAVSAGSLPTGLSLDPNSGLILGTPTSVGNSTFTISLTDSVAASTSRAYSMNIIQSPAPTLLTASLTAGQKDVPYGDVISATGGKTPYTFSITAGSLPAGITLNAATGLLSGTPTATGTSIVTARVTDSLGSFASTSLSLTIGASPYATLAFQTTTILPMTVGENDVRPVTVTGGLPPYTFSISAGALPAGISQSTTTGTLSGIPTVAGSAAVTLAVTDSRATTATQAFTVSVNAALTVTTSTLPVAIVGVAYSTSLSVTGGTAPYTFAATGVPAGLSLAASSGILSGTAAGTSVSTIVVTVTDASGLTANKTLSLTATTTLSISTASVARSAILNPYTQTIVATGGVVPYTFSLSAGSLPAGLSLSSAGVISGSPSKGANGATGSFAFTVQVADASGLTATRAYTMSITSLPRIADDYFAPLRVARTGVPYMDWVRSWGGFGARTFSATSLPPGLALNATSGYLTGTPTLAGTYTPAITITDAYGFTTTRTRTVRVVAAAKTADFDGGIQTTSAVVGTYQQVDAQAADLNNDGNLDLAVLALGRLQIFLGNGLGGFGEPNVVTLATNPANMMIADMDADLNLDVVTSTNSGANRLEIIKGDGVWTNPAALLRQTITLASTTYQVALGDLNGDSKMDFVVSNGNIVSVFMNCGFGGTTVNYAGNPIQACSTTAQTIFNYHIAATVARNSSVGAGLSDLNADGNLDLLVTAGTSLYTYPGLGNGTFSGVASIIGPFGNTLDYIRTHVEPTSGWTNTYISTAANFINMNGDGFRDIVLQANFSSYVLLGDGTGSFSQTYTANVSDLGSAVYTKVKDINNDTNLDIISVVRGGASTSISSAQGMLASAQVFYNNSGTGQVSNRMIIPTSYYATVATGKFITAATRPALAIARGWNGNPVQAIVHPNNNSPSGFNTGTFQFAYTTASGLQSDSVLYGVSFADLNSDGFLDFIGKLPAANIVSFLGQAGGSFANLTSLFGSGDQGGAQWWASRQLVLGDLDGDGILDLASANYNNAAFSSVGFNFGSGDGYFGPSNIINVDGSSCNTNNAQGAMTVTIADYNRDSKMDMAIGMGCGGNGRIGVYFGLGDGTFNTSSPTNIVASGGGANNYIDQLVSYDINGDGNQDLIAGGRNGSLSIYTGGGDGTFTLRTYISAGAGTSTYTLDIADMNNDFQPDYVMSTSSGAWSLLLGGSNGSTGSPSTYSGMGIISALVGRARAVDWDADGKLDVVMSKTNAGLQFFKGGGDGTFAIPTRQYSLPTAGNTALSSIFPVDLNGDGLDDLFCTQADTGLSNYSIGYSYNRSY